MVSTIPESFFVEHFAPWGQEPPWSCNWLQLWAANGLCIPHIGYLELAMTLCGKVVPGCGILVVRDPPDAASAAPGILGSNIIHRCYWELFAVYGPALLNSPSVVQAPGPILEALQRCHQASSEHQRNITGSTRVHTHIWRSNGTCGDRLSGAAGLLASPCLIRVKTR